MKTQRELEKIFQRQFESDYFPLIQALQKQFLRTNRSNCILEVECAKAQAALEKVMDKSQFQQVDDLKATFASQQDLAIRFCFVRGIYVAFSRYFDPDRDLSYYDLIIDDLFNAEKKAKHPEYWNLRKQSEAQEIALENSLSAQEDQINLTTVACTHGEHVHAAAVMSFYCGYQAALSLLDEVKPLTSGSMMKNILYAEYRMGLTRPYKWREQRFPTLDV